jgi:hypothetical protein
MNTDVTQAEIEAAVQEILIDVEPEISAAIAGKGKWAVIGFKMLWPILSLVLTGVLSGYIVRAVGVQSTSA